MEWSPEEEDGSLPVLLQFSEALGSSVASAGCQEAAVEPGALPLRPRLTWSEAGSVAL